MLKTFFTSLSLATVVLSTSLGLPQTVGAIDAGFEERTSGQILLQVESHGEAWYVDPVTKMRYYLPDGVTAYEMMRAFGLGISEADYLRVAGFDHALLRSLRGRIILRVEAHGEAYYLHPDGNVYYLADGDAAYAVMREHSLGITNSDLSYIPFSQFVPLPYPTPTGSLPTDGVAIPGTEVTETPVPEEVPVVEDTTDDTLVTPAPAPEPAPAPTPEVVPEVIVEPTPEVTPAPTPTPAPVEPEVEEVFNNTLYVGPSQTYKTIEGAIKAANDGDLILVEPGTYTDRLLVYDDITIRSTSSAADTIIAEGAQLSVLKTWGNLTLDGFTVTTTSDVARHCIRVAPYASIILKNSIVTECTAGDGLGGGLRFDTDTWGIVQDTVFENNYAVDPRGSRAAHLYSRADSVVIERSSFINGVTDSGELGDGGAIFANSGTLTITDSTFTGNFAGDDGGAIGLEGLAQENSDHTFSDGVSLLVLTNNVFESNTAEGNGGVLFARDVAEVEITGNTFCSNSAGADGEDLYLENTGGTVSDNELTGEVHLESATTVVTNNTVVGTCTTGL